MDGAKGKTVLIIGATGSVGAHAAVIMKQHGYRVYAVGRRSSDNGFFEEHGIPYFSVDVRDSGAFNSLPTDVDAVIHLAGSMPAKMEGYRMQEYVDSIVTGTINVLEYIRRIGCRKIIFGHSIADIVYKFGTTEPIDDDSERRPPLNTDHSVYSICKNTAVDLILHYREKYGIAGYVLRFPTIYLYRPSPFYYVDGVKKWMGFRYIIEQAKKGNTLEVWGNPDSIKETIYIKDLVHLMECCVNSETCSGGVFNAGTGMPISIHDQIKAIAEVFAPASGKSEIVFKPDKPSSPQFVLSIEKARRELGYSPQYSFKMWLEDFKQEMETEPYGKLWGYGREYYLPED